MLISKLDNSINPLNMALTRLTSMCTHNRMIMLLGHFGSSLNNGNKYS